jgi:hypothetical protein
MTVGVIPFKPLSTLSNYLKNGANSPRYARERPRRSTNMEPE